jgi:glutaredoxin-like protein
MNLIDDSTKEEVRKNLSQMKEDVEILFFESEGQFTNEIKQLLSEISEINSKVKISFHNVGDEKSKYYDINEGPVLKILSKHLKGDFRFYGIPSGYEFATLLYILNVASNGEINGPLVDVSKKINNDIKLEVFLSPTCPHCPSSAIVAFKLAMLNEKVKAHVYEVMEFPQKAQKYKVSGIPKTIINEGKYEYIGGLPEDMASKEILKTI